MREPVVAGQFYPSNPKELKKEIRKCFKDIGISSHDLIGAVVPHAGYGFSGHVAAQVYARIPRADTYIIIGPNHTGYGSAISASADTWSTPLGEVRTDGDLVKSLAGSIIDVDELAHRFEHSIEVQLPFLQYTLDHNFEILPICMGLQDEETASEVGHEIARAVKDAGKKVVIIASSDFTHYQSADIAYDTDQYIIEAIEKMDVSEIYRRIMQKNASACGFGPIAAMITAARLLGATKAELLTYSTSGDVIGDMSSVVGYGAITVE